MHRRNAVSLLWNKQKIFNRKTEPIASLARGDTATFLGRRWEASENMLTVREPWGGLVLMCVV